MASYYLSVRAEQDLEDILDYTWDTHGEAAATKYLSGLKRHLDMLARNPLLAPERLEFTPPVRIYPSHGHYLIYAEREGGIIVIRILHQRMNVGDHL
ncbi:MAG: type II toxin-antitoxin system RelE/ParE family toxin [Hyphomicrobiales bacterium]